MSAKIEDLELGLTWLRSYEGREGEEDTLAIARTADWLEREIARRRDVSTLRTIARRAGVSIPKARRALRRAREEGAA